jgi:hypothetical protein
MQRSIRKMQRPRVSLFGIDSKKVNGRCPAEGKGKGGDDHCRKTDFVLNIY